MLPKFSQNKQTQPSQHQYRFQPRLEPLEDRVVPADFGINPGDAFIDLPIKQRIAAEFPEISNPNITDFEKTNILRQWAYQNVDITSDPALKLDADFHSYYGSSAAQIVKQFDNDIGGVLCGGTSYFLEQLYRMYGYSATRIDGGVVEAQMTHATTLVKIVHNGSERIIIQDAYFNATVVDQSGNPLPFSEALKLLKSGDDSNIIALSGDITGRDYLSTKVTNYISESPGFQAVRPGVWKAKRPMDWARFSKDWFNPSFLEGTGYAKNMLSIFMFPLNEWGRAQSARGAIYDSVANLLRPAFNGPGTVAPGDSIVIAFGDGQNQHSLQPYGPGFKGEIGFVRGDINGDGVLDVVAAPRTAGGPHVVVFDGHSGDILHSFVAYDPAFTGGVNLAVGDVNADGHDDIITAPRSNGGPHVRVFDGATHEVLREFLAYDPAFSGGVNLAVADFNGDERADIITAPNSQGASHVRVFDGTNLNILSEFFAYDKAYFGGVNLAVGDINGDGRDDIITAPVAGASHVRVFDGVSYQLIWEFFAYDPKYVGGINVAVGDVNGDGRDDIITSPQAGGPHVRVFDGASRKLVSDFFAYDPVFNGEVFVESGDVDGDGVEEVITSLGGAGPYLRAFDGPYEMIWELNE